MADKTIIKMLLSIDVETSPLLIDNLVDLVEAQLKNRLGGVTEVPAALEYIVVNVVVARFNQIGDEGKSSMSIEGESASWLPDLFEPYEKDIRLYMDRENGTVSGGSIAFL